MKRKIMVTDGMDVAGVFMSSYINVLGFKEEPFLHGMQRQSQEIQGNMTYLAFEWMHQLSKIKDFDGRNEASVLMARDVCLHVPEMPKLHVIPYSGETYMEVEISDDGQVVEMMTAYLAADSKNAYQDFLLYATIEEGTLQQTMARLFRMWLGMERECPLAQRASSYCEQHTLPYI
ncbi:MAG: hypothetical protein Q4D16_14580 [Eubacteriales bacterium]|nr:hypothetical protein [Eubacteriales bacterium]